MDKDLSDENQKKKRRKRTDEYGRNYTCSCGKSYLSYPALYTHIKTKHSSKLDQFAPNRFNKDQQQESSPVQKSNENKITPKEQQKPEQQVECTINQPALGISLASSDSTIMSTFREILSAYFPNAQAKIFGKNKTLFTDDDKKFLKESKQYWNGKKKQDDKINNQGIIQASIEVAFGKFIYQIDKDMGSPMRKYIYLFFLKMRKYIQQMKGKGYCQTGLASELPGMFNQLIIQFLGDDDQHLNNPTLVAKSMFFFARWLYAVKYTNLSLKYNF